MGTSELLKQRRREILDLASKYGARNVRVFGSAGRGDDCPHSDIDLLVQMEPGRNLLDVAGLMTDLRDLLGRRVDIVTESSIYWLLRRRILKEATPL